MNAATLSRIGLWAMLSIFVVCSLWVIFGVFGVHEPDVRTGSFVTNASISGQPALSPHFAPANDAPAVSELASLPSGNAQRVSTQWAASAAAATGIPLRALTGYAGAALALATETPSCHLGWTTLAAIGNIESGHGTHANSSISADGVTRPPIYGPLLDGSQFAAVADTDAGQFDFNTQFDRAVGPLQFIPSTWALWGADGNGDGVKDPQQIDDAALATGRYLCHYGDLSGAEGWRRAVFAYNHVDVYVDSVAATANTYDQRMGQL